MFRAECSVYLFSFIPAYATTKNCSIFIPISFAFIGIISSCSSTTFDLLMLIFGRPRLLSERHYEGLWRCEEGRRQDLLRHRSHHSAICGGTAALHWLTWTLCSALLPPSSFPSGQVNKGRGRREGRKVYPLVGRQVIRHGRSSRVFLSLHRYDPAELILETSSYFLMCIRF